MDVAALQDFTAGYEPEVVTERTGLTAAQLRSLAQRFGEADAAIALALGTLAAVRARPKSVNVAVAEPTCRYPVWLPAAPLAR